VRIVVDRTVCIGAAMCLLTAPELFDQDADDGRVVVLEQFVEGKDIADARDAIAL
jgi:ferredoxin